MRYLLDTNVVSALMRGAPAAAARLQRVQRGDVAISQITVAELEYGLRSLPVGRRRTQLQAQWRTIGGELNRVPWDDAVSLAFAEQKARLERSGRLMSDFDLAIAAHAIALRLTLVTADSAFERVGVRRENWLR